jgi:hypothetical protein
LIPVLIDFSLNIKDKVVFPQSPPPKPDRQIVEKKINETQKKEWITKISQSQTQVVIEEMVNNPIVQKNKNLYDTVVNLSSRWNNVMEAKHRGNLSFEESLKQINIINDSVISTIRKL